MLEKVRGSTKMSQSEDVVGNKPIPESLYNPHPKVNKLHKIKVPFIIAMVLCGISLDVSAAPDFESNCLKAKNEREKT